jgi:hypothetical protein
MKNLEEMPDRSMQMDLQNVLYRYFAESARFFKKIQHCVRLEKQSCWSFGMVKNHELMT